MAGSRYENLLKVIDSGMNHARKSLDTSRLVHDSYGEDTSVYGGTEMLVGVMDSMMDKINSTVDQDMKEYFQQQDIPKKLNEIDATIEKLKQEEAERAQKEEEDRNSTIGALNATLLPDGVTLDDVLTFQNYQHQIHQRNMLKEKLAALQEEIDQLEKNQQETKSSIDSCNQQLKGAAQELERSADVCSMVASN